MRLVIKAADPPVSLTIVGLVICVPLIPSADRIVVAQVDAKINGRFKGQLYGNPAGEDLVLILGQNTLVSHYKVSTPRIVICQIKGHNRPAEVNYLEAVAPKCAPMLAQERSLGAIIKQFQGKSVISAVYVA